MLILCCLVTVICNNFGVGAFIPIAIGIDTILSANEIASSPVWHTDPPEPSLHPGYNVSNVGKTAVNASIYWKDSWPLQADDVFCEALSKCRSNSSVNVWYQLSGAIQIDPFESAIVRPSENHFYYTRLVVISNHPENSSIVSVKYEADETDSARHLQKKRDTGGTPSGLPLSSYLKRTFRYGHGFTGIRGMVALFWPENAPNVWNEVRDYVRNLIDPDTSAYINTLLNGRLTAMKLRLAELAREVNEGHSEVSFHYMNIAQDLIGLEAEFVIRNHHNAEKLNFDLLPLYSNVVLMKAAYYAVGLRCSQKMYLYGPNVANIERYFNNTIRSPQTGANKYMLEVFKSQQNQSAGNEFDRIMSAHNALVEQGYVPVWNNMMDRPGKPLYDTKITYAQLIGEQNYKMLHYAQEQPKEPLTPLILSTGRFNRLRSLTTYLSTYSCISDPPIACIDGVKLTYENNAEYTFYKYNENLSVRRVVELDDSSRISSVMIKQVDSNLASLSVGVQRRAINEFSAEPTSIYYDLGFMKMDGANVSLEITDYQVASIFPSWSGESLALAVSFIPNDASIYQQYDNENGRC